MKNPTTSAVRVVERTELKSFANVDHDIVRTHCLPVYVPSPWPHARVLVVDMHWLCQEHGSTERYGKQLKRWERTVLGKCRSQGLGLLCWRLKPQRERRDAVDFQGPIVCIRTGAEVAATVGESEGEVVVPSQTCELSSIVLTGSDALLFLGAGGRRWRVAAWWKSITV
jgi:hypothetical protein